MGIGAWFAVAVALAGCGGIGVDVDGEGRLCFRVGGSDTASEVNEVEKESSSGEE